MCHAVTCCVEVKSCNDCVVWYPYNVVTLLCGRHDHAVTCCVEVKSCSDCVVWYPYNVVTLLCGRHDHVVTVLCGSNVM